MTPKLYRSGRTLFGLACAAALAACTPTLDIQTSSSYGPAMRLNGMGDTYAWCADNQGSAAKTEAANGGANGGSNGTPNDEVGAYIRKDISQELRKRGFSEVSDRPSFCVSYRVQKRTAARYNISPHGKFVEEGSIIIDAVDPGTSQNIWRGTASAHLNDAYTPEVRKGRIDVAIRKLMEQFPRRVGKAKG